VERDLGIGLVLAQTVEVRLSVRRKLFNNLAIQYRPIDVLIGPTPVFLAVYQLEPPFVRRSVLAQQQRKSIAQSLRAAMALCI
jgi:hypothetical protein